MKKRSLGFAALAVLVLCALAPPVESTPRKRRGLHAKGVTFLSNVDEHGSYNDVWGYTAPDGREYALLGTGDGISVVNVSRPRLPYETGFIPRSHANWRDIKTYGHYAYAVQDRSGGGIAIIDLSDPEDPRLASVYTQIWWAHNLYIDEPSARAFVAGYTVGPGSPGGGVRILSLEDPLAPRHVGTWSGHYAHDVFVRGDRMFVSAIQDPALYVLDVSNLPTIRHLARIGEYPSAFTHNAWTTEDGNYVLVTDEKPGAACRMWDVTDPASPTQADAWVPPSAQRAIPHNALIDGDLAYISYYTAGVRIVDVSDPHDLREVGFFDTVLSNNIGVFDGCWGVFPYFPNSPDLFVLSDVSRGLFVLRRTPLVTEAGRGEISGARPHRSEGVALGRATPNPVRAGETTSFALATPLSASVEARVHDAAGRLVKLLRAGSPADRRIVWDGRNARGEAVSSGVYFLTVETGDRTESRRITVVR